MSEDYERMQELRDPLLRLADAAEQLAGNDLQELRDPLLRLADAAEQLAGNDLTMLLKHVGRLAEAVAALPIPPQDDMRLARVEDILFGLYPDTCKRHGLDLSRAAARPVADS
jgi:hypothetical protein